MGNFHSVPSFVRTGLLLALGATGPAHAVSDGFAGTAGTIPGEDCTRAGCHVVEIPAVPVPQVAVAGPTSATPGSVNKFTVTISGGPSVSSGIDVAASGGTLSIVTGATDVKVLQGEIVHAVPKPMVGGSVTYAFDWTAPATNGTYTLFVAGMASDGTARQGDGTTLATAFVTVAGATNQPPVAVISGPASGVAGATLTFDGSSSSDPDGTIGNYAWNFGDGTAGAGPSVTKTYPAGNYTLRLTVTDNLGATNTTQSNLTIAAAGAAPPTANAGGPYTGTVGAAVSFNGAGSTDPDGTISTYDWTFGDGTTGSGVATTRVYTTAGQFTVTLTVTDNSGLTGSQQTTATIAAAAPPGGGTPPPPATGGEALYAANCASCHGANGVGGPDGDVLGASADDILDAIDEEPAMASLASLPAADIDAIAAFLDQSSEDADDAVAAAAASSNPAGRVSTDEATDSVSRGPTLIKGGGAIDATLLVAGLLLVAGCGQRSRGAKNRPR